MKNLVFLFLLLLASTTQAQKLPFVGNSYNHLDRSLGSPTDTIIFTDLTILEFDGIDYFWYNSKTDEIIRQRSYVHKAQIKRLIKLLGEHPYKQGWYYSTNYDLKMQLLVVNGEYRLEITNADNNYISFHEE